MRARTHKILALSGSLRSNSVNTQLLRVAVRIVPDRISYRLFDGLAGLPAFDPDDETSDTIAPTVVAWRNLVASADALVMSVPEYAGGLPVAFKTRWIGSSETFGSTASPSASSAPPSIWSSRGLRFAWSSERCRPRDRRSPYHPSLGKQGDRRRDRRGSQEPERDFDCPRSADPSVPDRRRVRKVE